MNKEYYKYLKDMVKVEKILFLTSIKNSFSLVFWNLLLKDLSKIENRKLKKRNY